MDGSKYESNSGIGYNECRRRIYITFKRPHNAKARLSRDIK